MAIEVAESLGATLDVVIPHKMAIPHGLSTSYGTVTEEGAVILDEPLVKMLGLTEDKIQQLTEEVQNEIARRSVIYRRKLKVPRVEGKTAIIVDDGLATGFTMRAAIDSIRHRKAVKVIVAAPVASKFAYDQIKSLADELVCLVIAHVRYFVIASFYCNWYDLTDEEVVKSLEEWQAKHAGGP